MNLANPFSAGAGTLSVISIRFFVPPALAVVPSDVKPKHSDPWTGEFQRSPYLNPRDPGLAGVAAPSVRPHGPAERKLVTRSLNSGAFSMCGKSVLAGLNAIAALQSPQVFGHRLPSHAASLAKLAQRLAIPRLEVVQQPPPHRVGQRPEDGVHTHAALYATI